MASEYVIGHKDNYNHFAKQSEKTLPDENLFWSNADGWVDSLSATRFSFDEITDVTPPLEAGQGYTTVEQAYQLDMLLEIAWFYANGHRTVNVTFENAGKQETKKIRLFVAVDGRLCYFPPRKRRSGYNIQRLDRYGKIVAVSTITKQKKSQLDVELDNLRKFKNAFTKRVHPNLWKTLQDGYADVDVEEARAKFEAGTYEEKHGVPFGFWHMLHDVYGGANVVAENNYKTTTIKSNRPRGYGHSGYWSYESCVKNIQEHLDKKEDFHYNWESNYDVTVSGKMGEDGVYRAWLNLEYRGCGNGHYYILINNNSAVFAEDD